MRDGEPSDPRALTAAGTAREYALRHDDTNRDEAQVREAHRDRREEEGVRLPPNYIDAIKIAADAAFGASVVVRLYGSRVRDGIVL